MQILEFNGRKFIVSFYATQKVAQKLGISISNLGYAIDSQLYDLAFWYLFYSAEYSLYKEDKANDFTEKDIYILIDESGGSNSDFMRSLSSAIAIELGLKTDDGKTTEKDKKKAEILTSLETV